MLGRSGSRIEHLGSPHGMRVLKHCATAKEEAAFMMRHPDVFVGITNVTPSSYMMRCLRPAHPAMLHQLGEGLEKLRILWGRIPSTDHVFTNPNWRAHLISHLEEQITKHQLQVSKSFAQALVLALPSGPEVFQIHGDPTLANLVYDGFEPFWIDPLQRPYIPNMACVDVGKMFQSCWGYEQILCKMKNVPQFNRRVAEELAEAAGVNFEDAFKWCIVHLIRLLPYQSTRVRVIFEDLLRMAELHSTLTVRS